MEDEMRLPKIVTCLSSNKKTHVICSMISFVFNAVVGSSSAGADDDYFDANHHLLISNI